MFEAKFRLKHRGCWTQKLKQFKSEFITHITVSLEKNYIQDITEVKLISNEKNKIKLDELDIIIKQRNNFNGNNFSFNGYQIVKHKLANLDVLIKKNICFFEILEDLNLENCFLGGLPENFVILKKLKGLNLIKNSLNQVPEEIFKLNILESLFLAYNLYFVPSIADY